MRDRHVKVSELPQSWRESLAAASDARVTVRIEEESFATDDAYLVLGMWRDRDDLADVAAYIRRLRAPRFERKSGRAMLVDTDVVTEFMAATD